MKSPWTEPRTERLKQLWSDGRLSASQIAAELGGITRNSVIGKAHRLNLSGRAKPPPQERRTAREKWAAWDAKRGPERLSKDGEVHKHSRFNPSFGSKKRTTRALTKLERQSMKTPDLKHAVGIFAHREGQCRWIVAEAIPNIHHLRYCGSPVAHRGCSHCEYHLDVSVNGYPPQAKAA